MPETKIYISKKVEDKLKSKFLKIIYHETNGNAKTAILHNKKFKVKKVNRVDNVIDYELENISKILLNSITTTIGFKFDTSNQKTDDIKSTSLSYNCSKYQDLLIFITDNVRHKGMKKFDSSISILNGNHIESILLITNEDKTTINSKINSKEYEHIITSIIDENDKKSGITEYNTYIEDTLFDKICKDLNASDIEESVKKFTQSHLLVLHSKEFNEERNSKKLEYERKLKQLSQVIVSQTKQLAQKFRQTGFKLTSAHSNSVTNLIQLSMKFAEVEKYYKEIAGNLTFYNSLRENIVAQIKNLHLGPNVDSSGNNIDMVVANLYFGDFDYMSDEYLAELK